MNHIEAWKLVGGDFLIFCCYVLPPALFIFFGKELNNEGSSEYVFSLLLTFAVIFYVSANLISAGVIK